MAISEYSSRAGGAPVSDVVMEGFSSAKVIASPSGAPHLLKRRDPNRQHGSRLKKTEEFCFVNAAIS
jgi:hypothetical protein